MSDLLPPNATPQERALALAAARISDVPMRVRESWNPDSCPASILPWLAWAYSVDEWDVSWSDDQKRASIKRAVAVHRYKGTIGAVRDALAAIGVSIQVQEWFNQVPAGAPYTYKLLLDVDQIGIEQATLQKVLRVVDSSKNLRSHMDLVLPSIRTRSQINVAGANGLGSETAVTNGVDDIGLLMEGARNGFPETEQAVDGLHTLLHTTMPAANYW
ncbi:hypothetical protein LMG31506_02999 [Cupriavidus yeoncheonensis]|uniref:Phage tail protein I n=1 Tax=Cupriavidus yeoncheonensis TaxID=1462994 RepID=A0A916MY57_9BURK|nr:phage tail protein I [Cupriavidus yeoncheonensis]CAG2144408.1 hypothetical protein LMG31506_02999 [Cupriavidus yeoncheonensis]